MRIVFGIWLAMGCVSLFPLLGPAFSIAYRHGQLFHVAMYLLAVIDMFAIAIACLLYAASADVRKWVAKRQRWSGFQFTSAIMTGGLAWSIQHAIGLQCQLWTFDCSSHLVGAVLLGTISVVFLAFCLRQCFKDLSLLVGLLAGQFDQDRL